MTTGFWTQVSLTRSIWGEWPESYRCARNDVGHCADIQVIEAKKTVRIRFGGWGARTLLRTAQIPVTVAKDRRFIIADIDDGSLPPLLGAGRVRFNQISIQTAPLQVYSTAGGKREEPPSYYDNVTHLCVHLLGKWINPHGKADMAAIPIDSERKRNLSQAPLGSYVIEEDGGEEPGWK